MSGSQGELAHIDLSDGNEILRVLLEREGNYGGSYGSIVRLRVGRCNEDLSRTHTCLLYTSKHFVEVRQENL